MGPDPKAWSVKGGFFSTEPHFEVALALAELHGAFGLHAKLQKMQSRHDEAEIELSSSNLS